MLATKLRVIHIISEFNGKYIGMTTYFIIRRWKLAWLKCPLLFFSHAIQYEYTIYITLIYHINLYIINLYLLKNVSNV